MEDRFSLIWCNSGFGVLTFRMTLSAFDGINGHRIVQPHTSKTRCCLMRPVHIGFVDSLRISKPGKVHYPGFFAPITIRGEEDGPHCSECRLICGALCYQKRRMYDSRSFAYLHCGLNRLAWYSVDLLGQGIEKATLVVEWIRSTEVGFLILRGGILWRHDHEYGVVWFLCFGNTFIPAWTVP